MSKYYDQINTWSPLLKIIRKAESTYTDPYNSIVNAKPLTGLSSKSIEEAISFSKKERPGSKYIGAYQFNLNDLLEWAVGAGLNESSIFNSKNQDNIALYLILNRAKGFDWFKNKITQDAFMENLAKIWAGLPIPTAEKSYYDGINGNSSTVTRAEVRASLNQVKLKEDTISIPDPDTDLENIIPLPESTRVNITLISESQILEYIE